MKLISIYLHFRIEARDSSKDFSVFDPFSSSSYAREAHKKRLFIALCTENSLYNKNASFSTYPPPAEMFKSFFPTPFIILKLYREMASRTHTRSEKGNLLYV